MLCEGKVAVVTGSAGRGMGRSTALTLAREGAKVVVNYRTSQQSATEIVEHIRRRGGAAIAVEADVFEVAGCRQLISQATDQFGQVDICVVGPGAGWHPEGPRELGVDDALDDIRRELAPLYHLMPLVLPGMYERRWGRLIGIGLVPPYSSPAYSYNVAKAARAQGLLLASQEAWQNGVTVNVVGPGPIPEIASLQEAVEKCDHGPAWWSRATVSPQDIAEGIAFLCSEAGRFITGCDLPYPYRAPVG